MSAASNYYSGSYDYNNGGNIYVHLHVRNIGRAMNGPSVAPSQVASIFKERKNQALNATKKQFRTLFKNSLDTESVELLNQVFNNDDLMTELQRQIGEKLQKALSVDKMQALMAIQKSGIATDNFAQTILEQSEESIKNFDILLNSLAQAASLLDTKSGARLAVLLSHQHKINNRIQLGRFLSKALSDFEKENQKVLMTDLEIQQADQIAGTIKSLAKALQTGKIKKGKGDTIGKAAVRRMIESIFNTGFAESISAILKNTTFVSLGQAFQATLTGSKEVQIEYNDQFGNAIAKSKGEAAAGKADAVFKNVQMKINSSNKQITLNIGISDKFYKTNHFPGLRGNENKNLYSAGAGGPLVQALWSSFGSNLKYLYYAYNTLSHSNRAGWNETQGALNEVILTRQIIRLFSSRGGSEDFAQFMFVNGQIVPIWDIIISTIENISLSSARGQQSQPVTLSISGKEDIQKAAQNYRRTIEERIYSVNKAIQKAKITAHLNLNNLN